MYIIMIIIIIIIIILCVSCYNINVTFYIMPYCIMLDCIILRCSIGRLPERGDAQLRPPGGGSPME